MLEVSGVVDSRCQHYHVGVGNAWGSQVQKGLQQVTGVVIDGLNLQVLKDLRECTFHYPAILQHVGNARGTAKVIFEDVPLTVAIAHEVGSGNVAPDSTRRFQANASFLKACGRFD